MSPSEPRDEEPDDLVGLPAIAEEIGMNPSSVRKWVLTGRLPARKDGRKWLVSRAHVVELARSGMVLEVPAGDTILEVVRAAAATPTASTSPRFARHDASAAASGSGWAPRGVCRSLK